MKTGLVVLALIGLVNSAGVAAAGECVDGREAYIAALEAGPGDEAFDYATYCVDYDGVLRGALWAGPNAAQAFAAIRADTLRRRIELALTHLHRSAWADSGDNRQRLYGIAAHNAIERIDGIDVFTARFSGGGPWEYGAYEGMAILQDCRAVDVLLRRYFVLRARPNPRDADEIISVLNCLYHIPCAQSREVAQRLFAIESDKTLRARLRNVIDRPPAR